MSTDYKLLDAYDKITSTKITERNSGLSDLKQLLSNAQNAKTLNDKGYHKMYEALFRAVMADKKLYMKQDPNAKMGKSVASRLSMSGSVLRLAVEMGVTHLKPKTVKAVYSHIIDVLPMGTQYLCEPISLDYIKALRACLDYPTHTEHLQPADWGLLARFCCQHLGILLGLVDNDEEDENEPTGNAGRGNILLREDSMMSRRSGGNSQSVPKLSHDSEELFGCLRCLVAASNAPIIDNAEMICDTLLGFLSSQPSMTRAHHPVFSSLNFLLVSVTVNNIELASRISDEIVQTVIRLWDTKSPGFKDEMLISLIYCQPHIRNKIRESQGKNLALRRNVEDLLETLCNEYISRTDRDSLQIDDIVFPNPLKPLNGMKDSLSLRSMGLRKSLGDFRTEQTWVTTSLIARMIEMLDRFGDSSKYPRNMEDTDKATVKRQRMYNNFDEIMRFVRSSNTPRKLLALQVLPFLSDIGGINEEDYANIVQSLYEACSDDNSSVSSWALLSIGSCAFLKTAWVPSHVKLWQQVWQLCTRYAANHSTCRAACHVMRIILSNDLILYSNISKEVDSIIASIDLNGPASIADSSLALWTLVLEKRNTVAQSSRLNPGERLFMWFMAKWHPADDLERTGGTFYTQHKLHFVSAIDAINFLSACAGIEYLEVEPEHHWVYGPIGRACRRNYQYYGLQSVLLDLFVDEETKVEKLHKQSNISGLTSRNPGLELKIIDLLDQQTYIVHEKWKTITSAQVQHVTESVLRNFAGFIIISSIMCLRVTTEESKEKSKALKHKLETMLFDDLISYLAQDACTEKQVDGILLAVSDFLPEPAQMVNSTGLFRKIFRETIGNIFSQIYEAINKKDSAEASLPASLHDPTDIDDGFGASSSFRYEKKKGGGLQLREELQALCSEDGFRASTKALMALCACVIKHEEPVDFCGDFVDYLIKIPKTQLVMARPVVQKFLSSSSDKICDDDLVGLCEYMAEELLQGYDIERCEINLLLCFYTIDALVVRWVMEGQDDEITDCCKAVYDHAIKIGLDRRVTSHTIRMSIARLLHHMIDTNRQYKATTKKPPITLYFELLSDRDVRVTYHISQKLPDMFSNYEAASHATLFTEVEKFLPQEKDWPEGLAIRVHTLAKLAPAGSSSISRIVFRIFETGSVANSVKYAERALLSVARASGLHSQKDLFKLFSSKLVFAWTEFYELKEFPFRAFGYSSLKELYSDVTDELIAQLLAKDKDDDVEFVSTVLEISSNELLVQSFPKVIAYGLAWAIGQPPKKEPKRPSVDVRVRKQLGDAKYVELAANSFRLIISHLFQLMLGEGTSEKFLSRDPAMAEAYQVMQDIAEQGFSKQKLADPLRPYWKERIILNAINHFCGQAQLDGAKLWSPEMVAFITREILDTLHPARGSVYACSIIRVLRLLICLAGPVVFEGYLLEMIIHGLKPYVIDSYCCEDTIGILRYLFIHGQPYLSTKPTFVLGFFLSLLASLRDRLRESSNIRYSHVDQDDMSVAKEFHTWVADQLLCFNFSMLDDIQTKAFQSIITSAVGFQEHGNALKKTKESELLRHLLDDDIRKNRLLDDTSRRLAFTLCTSDFARPESFRDDIFGNDEESFKRSKSLLSICKRFNVNDGFLLWSARVLGRSYAATGQLHNDWMREIEFSHPTGFDIEDFGIDYCAKAGILHQLRGLLLLEDSSVVSIVEHTLERVIYEESHPTATESPTWNEALGESDFKSLRWHELPDSSLGKPIQIPILATEKPESLPVEIWIKKLTSAICSNLPYDPVAYTLIPILEKLDGLAEELFHYVAHIFLLRGLMSPKLAAGHKDELSQIFQECLRTCTEETVAHNTILIKCILYLRTQATVKEIRSAKAPATGTKYLRDLWLDIDFLEASRAACTCRMFKTALLFAEIHYSKNVTDNVPSELLLEIFKNVDDPDSYYGVNQAPSLENVLNGFEYEGDGWKSLSLRGANLESRIRLGVDMEEEDLGVVNALNNLGLNGLSRSFLTNGIEKTMSEDGTEKMFQSAWKLEQWDLSCPRSCKTRSATIYRALQSVNSTIDSESASLHVDPPFLEVMRQITAGIQTGHTLGGGMRTLAMLTEMEEILGSSDSNQVEEVWEIINKRTKWMHTGRYSDVGEIMSMRQATFGSLAKKEHLQASTKTDPKTARFLEAKTLVGYCKMARSHKILQHALSAATQLSKVVEPCKEVGLDINAVATLQAAHVLWDDGQGIASIRMLQSLEDEPENSQSLVVGKPKLLAKLGNRVSEARLEKPDKIMRDYLEKAIERLNRQNKGSDAGRVFHEFATFCDQQLQNQGNIEDYERALKLRQAKEEEVRETERLVKENPKKREFNHHLNKAKTWLQLDNIEVNRLKLIRETFLEKSILNHLRCLAACDDYDSEAVRFCALWLANLNNPKVNSAASIIESVPSRKFVPLINQLSSRLQDTQDDFQRLLMHIILRMCKDHPYHSVYQILALSKTRTKDDNSIRRQQAASKVALALKANAKSQKVFTALDDSTQSYTRLAGAKVSKNKDGKPVPLRSFLSRERYAKFEHEIPASRIPPPTMNINVRPDCDYSHLPWLEKFDPDVSIASGISAPKIIKCQASDGQIFKLLVKGGNDDLRQDAIMEQVFEQVSFLLQKNRITRQRNLKVRTYKVIPLTATSGIIEFVPNTIPLHDYILPAHLLYHPGDWHHSKCRKAISDAQNKTREVRVAEFLKAVSHYRPVMHYFFMHRFNGPDDWFASRLAYTRSTAAISILGHVLGLGDRHGHNILLDEKTGEVVHIDLGVAFEQGRILPVPEVVPFRLTRDIVDGMGVTKTEGVFRRCCEFTLEVLRNESYNITTILDVLRYDPLYSWSMSPVRMNRIQQHTEDQDGETTVNRLAKPKDDPGEAEADRALAVVAKKLSKTLSVGATVNELIQQAGDDRNLAVLYAGWAAFA